MEIGELEHTGDAGTTEPHGEDRTADAAEQPLDQSATVELIEIPSICLAGTENVPETGDARPDEQLQEA